MCGWQGISIIGTNIVIYYTLGIEVIHILEMMTDYLGISDGY